MYDNTMEKREEIKKVSKHGKQRVVIIPQKSNILIGDYVKISPIELNKETEVHPAKNETSAIEPKPNNAE
jgi:hypothetical protein